MKTRTFKLKSGIVNVRSDLWTFIKIYFLNKFNINLHKIFKV